MMNAKNNPITGSHVDAKDYNLDLPIAPVAPAIQERRRPVFTGMEDHSISVDEASSLTRNYRMAAGRGAVKGRYFSRVSLEQLLMQEGVVGVRYYYATDANGRPQMVLVGVDAHGADLTEGFLVSNGLPVSRFHEDPNPLNS